MGKLIVLGDGILGTEFVKQLGCDFISRKKDSFNIKNLSLFTETLIQYDTIINCIANTDTYSKDKNSHWETNYVFVNDLIQFCNENKIKLIHISTDYVYTNSVSGASEEDVPVHCDNWYGYTKLLSDGLVQLLSNDYLLIRCSHKPNPFPYEKAWVDQVGNFDYVDIICGKICKLINLDSTGVYNVGTELKSILNLASRTNSVQPTHSPTNAPKDISMNLNKLNSKLKRPFFSIAIPAYGYNGKGEEFLNHSFNILLNQKFKDFEVVISDHSQDDTIKNVCDSWSSMLNIRYLRNEIGRGVISPNLNNAIKNCQGEWIKILFQDDYLFNSNSLLNLNNFIVNNPDSVWIASSFWHTNDGKNLHTRLRPQWPDKPIWLGFNSIGCPSVLTIKNKDVIYFDETLNWLMDCEYYKRMFDLYGTPTFHDQDTIINRIVIDRLSNTISEKQKIDEVERMRSLYN